METFLGADGKCSVLRQQAGWSREELANRAGVSVKAVASIENKTILKPDAEAISPRKKRAVGRTVAQIAIALGEVPEKWLGSLAKEDSDYSLGPEDVKEILDDARLKVRDELRSWDLDFGKALTSNIKDEYEDYSSKVPVGFKETDKPELDAFLFELTSRVFRVLHHGLQPVKKTIQDEPQFTGLFANLSRPDNPYRLVVGPPRVPSRDLRYPIKFINIPGLSVGIVALVRQDSPLKWDTIADLSPRKSQDGSPLLHAVEEGVGHIYLRNMLGYKKTTITLHKNLSLKELTSLCRDVLSKDTALARNSAIFVDELVAVHARRSLRRRVNRSRDDPSRVDLKILRDDPSLAFPMAMTTRAADEVWGAMLEESLREVFDHTPKQMVDLYFNDFLRPLVIDLFDNNRPDGVIDIDDGFSLFKSGLPTPAYLRIIEDARFPFSKRFKQGIEKQLSDFLGREEFVEAINHAGSSVELVGRGLLGWLPSPELGTGVRHEAHD